MYTAYSSDAGVPNLDEEEVIRRCQEGERCAYQFVVEWYGKVLFGTAYSMTRDRQLAEDLVQEAFLLAWRNIPSFRLGTNFKAWLLRILVNRTISELRKKQVPEIDLDDPAVTLSDPDDVGDLVVEKEERHRIRQALERLPNEQREAMVLRYYADLTVPEIAKALGWREGTVKSRLHRALVSLRQLLAEAEVQTVSKCETF